MNISTAAERSGISAKMIRYYEQIGLIPAPARLESNYRDYTDADIARLRFLRRARRLGFSIDTITELLSQWEDPERNNAQVRALADRHIDQLKEQAAEIAAMIAALETLSDACRRNQRDSCPIIEALGGEEPADLPPPSDVDRRAPAGGNVRTERAVSRITHKT